MRGSLACSLWVLCNAELGVRCCGQLWIASGACFSVRRWGLVTEMSVYKSGCSIACCTCDLELK